MGLDMYLTGEVIFRNGHPNRQLKPCGKKVEQYELGYWRKHPNLHGYIVESFADGIDECQEIFLGSKNIHQIIEAIKNRELPETIGFFFGESDDSDEQIEEDVGIFEDALKWLEIEDEGVWKVIIYRASW